MFKEKVGDLVADAKNGLYDCIVHGCNCYHAMASGIALAISTEFPEAEAVDSKTAKYSYNKLGTLSIAQAENGTYIINAYTQFRPGADARMNALEMCLDKIAYIMKLKKKKSVGFPLIGAGIGGLDENEVVQKLRDWSELNSELDVTLVRYLG